MVTRAGCHVTCNKLAGQFITQREREREWRIVLRSGYLLIFVRLILTRGFDEDFQERELG